MTYSETDLAGSIKRLAGGQLGALTQEQLDGLDQFHAGGPAAVDRLLTGMRLEPGMRVLDADLGSAGRRGRSPALPAARLSASTSRLRTSARPLP